MAKDKKRHPKLVDDRPAEKLTLKYLLANITPENLHPETDWGPPVGKERWWE